MASADSGESKPAGEEGAAANPEHINLKVMGQDGNIVQFKIKKHTALKKLMSTYCERAGLALQVIFMLDCFLMCNNSFLSLLDYSVLI